LDGTIDQIMEVFTPNDENWPIQCLNHTIINAVTNMQSFWFSIQFNWNWNSIKDIM
jgi:hypothetical protein